MSLSHLETAACAWPCCARRRLYCQIPGGIRSNMDEEALVRNPGTSPAHAAATLEEKGLEIVEADEDEDEENEEEENRRRTRLGALPRV